MLEAGGPWSSRLLQEQLRDNASVNFRPPATHVLISMQTCL